MLVRQINVQRPEIGSSQVNGPKVASLMPAKISLFLERKQIWKDSKCASALTEQWRWLADNWPTPNLLI